MVHPPEELVHPPEESEEEKEEEEEEVEEPATQQPETGNVEESAIPAEVEAVEMRRNVKPERIRHYSREVIRNYMAKQKQIRKQTSGSPQTQVCNHTRTSPKRIDTGIPHIRKTSASRKFLPSAEPTPKFRIPPHEENWGPYESPKTLPALPLPEVKLKLINLIVI